MDEDRKMLFIMPLLVQICEQKRGKLVAQISLKPGVLICLFLFFQRTLEYWWSGLCTESFEEELIHEQDDGNDCAVPGAESRDLRRILFPSF